MPKKSTIPLSSSKKSPGDSISNPSQAEAILPQLETQKTLAPPFDTFPIEYAKYGLLGIIVFLILAFIIFIVSILFGIDISRLFI